MMVQFAQTTLTHNKAEDCARNMCYCHQSPLPPYSPSKCRCKRENEELCAWNSPAIHLKGFSRPSFIPRQPQINRYAYPAKL